MHSLPLFDSHTHLQDARLAGDLSGVLARARQAGVMRMVCCATAEKDWDATAAAAIHSSCVIPAFGIHPWFASPASDGWEQRLQQRLETMPSALGECGLDFAVANSDRDTQEHVFKRQLLLAKKMRKPVSIHCRKAWEKLTDLLAWAWPLPGGGLIHSYSGSAELIPRFVEFGMYISFSGAVCNPKSSRVHRAVKAVPDERLLIETDTPDILPYPLCDPQRNRLNEPANLVHVATSIAHHRSASVEKIGAIAYANAARLFGELIA